MNMELREILDKELSEYENALLTANSEEYSEESANDLFNRLFYNLDYDNRAILVQLKAHYDKLLSDKQKEAYLKGFSLALIHMQKNK